MYVSIRRYGVDPKDVPEIAKRVREGFLPIVREMAGFKSYQVLDTGGGFLASISAFETQQAARQSEELARKWARENLVGLLSGIPDVTTGQIVVQAP